MPQLEPLKDNSNFNAGAKLLSVFITRYQQALWIDSSAMWDARMNWNSLIILPRNYQAGVEQHLSTSAWLIHQAVRGDRKNV